MTGEEVSGAKRIVLLGAGHAHVQVLKSFGEEPVPGARLTLITPETHTPYSGMLPGLIAGHYGFEDAHIDVRPLCDFAGARLILDKARGIDTASQTVQCGNEPSVPYDVLSIDTGSTPNTASVPGASEHTIPVKPISQFLDRFEKLKERVLDAGGKRRIAVVGGGAGGVELTLSLEQRLRRELSEAGRDPAGLHFFLVNADKHILAGFPERFRKRFEAILRERGIDLIAGAPVTRVEEGLLQIEGKGAERADDILWVTAAQAPDWLEETGLRLSDKGFLAVDEFLRAEGTQDVFGAGDVIAFGPRSLPKSGVYAVRAGPVLAENIRRLVAGRALIPYQPQAEAMYLVSTGERYAIGTRNGLVFGGRWVWRWKDWIDRRFMAKFKDLPNHAVADNTA
jgi:selenide,water dikinase